MRNTIVLLAACVTGCMSGHTLRGVEDVGTTQSSSASMKGKCTGRVVSGVWAPPGFCVTQFANGLNKPRHMVFAPNGDLIVATRDGIAVVWDEGHQKAMLGGPDLSPQGIAISPDGRWLYIAESRVVRRMPFRVGLRQNEGRGEVVVGDVPLTNTHPYRSLTFDAQGRMYLQVGSDDNLSPGKGAAIMRYTVPDALPVSGIAYDSGEVFAKGIRNAEALAWDRDGRLWAFVNGRDFLHPPGTPENFYLDHPGDWIYRLSDKAGTFYGFPNCWVLGTAAWGERRDPGSQWADPDTNQGHDDAWCQNPANVWPAAGSLAAHTAPLGAVQYRGNAFPAEYRDSIFVTSHGSWNRHGEQRGRMVLQVRIDGDRVVSVSPFLGQKASDGNLKEGSWSERPVGVAVGPDGALYVSSDETGNILRVSYANE